MTLFLITASPTRRPTEKPYLENVSSLDSVFITSKSVEHGSRPVERLVDLLARAEAGEIHAICILYQKAGETEVERAGNWTIPELVFALQAAQLQLLLTNCTRQGPIDPEPKKDPSP